MRKDPGIILRDILESIGRINRYVGNMTLEEFRARDETQDAVVRKIEIIGEAAKRLPSEFQGLHQDIPWKQIGGMRDILIHEYFGINIERVWETVKSDLLGLKDRIWKILEAIQDPN